MSNSVAHPNYPFSAYLLDKVSEYSDETENVDSCICKAVRLAVSEVGYLFIDIIALVETVFWSALAIVATIFHIFIPESKSEWINKHIFGPIVDNAYVALCSLALSATMTFVQFASKETRENCIDYTIDGLESFEDKIITPISNFHICSGKKRMSLLINNEVFYV